ncbi:MAG: branched-chain amino acid ABC transporter permease [Frankia sp.]|nr:branched-chain amino acid ABC transporter permease [Frankia sp.]
MTATTTATTPPAPPAGQPGPARGARATLAAALLSLNGLRRLGTYLLLGLVAAVATGPDGTADEPLGAVRDSILDPRIVVFLLLAVALWLVVAAAPLARPLVTTLIARVREPVVASGLPQHRYAPIVTNLVLLAIAILAPLFLSGAARQALVNDIGIYALLALGLNVVIGYAGLLDLGYIAFFAIGAYATAYFTTDKALPVHSPFLLNPFLVMPIALILAAIAGVILGGPTLRLRGDYLAIVTLGFGEIIHLIANNADNLTNGPRGAFGVPHLSINMLGLEYDWGNDPMPYYYVLLVIVVAVMIAFGRLERSRIGRSWAAIREDEIAAEATGVPTLKMKLLAFAIGASVSGFAGVLFASKQFFNPQSFSLQASFLVVTLVIFGGMGSRLGVVVGVAVLQGLAYYLRDPVPPTDRYIYFGAVVILMMIFRPQGLIPSRRRKREIQLSEQGVGGADSLGGARPEGAQA